jgi:hypothetical protein
MKGKITANEEEPKPIGFGNALETVADIPDEI